VQGAGLVLVLAQREERIMRLNVSPILNAEQLV
jgi:hypothetical protein